MQAPLMEAKLEEFLRLFGLSNPVEHLRALTQQPCLEGIFAELTH
jgi:hypothetical protein